MKDRMKMFHILADAGMIILAYLAAYYVRFYTRLFHNELGNFYPLGTYTSFLVYLVPIYLFIYYMLRLYNEEPEGHKRHMVLRGVISNAVGIVLFITWLFLRKEYNISRKFILLFLIMNIAFTIGSRVLIFSHGKLKRKREKGIS